MFWWLKRIHAEKGCQIAAIHTPVWFLLGALGLYSLSLLCLLSISLRLLNASSNPYLFLSTAFSVSSNFIILLSADAHNITITALTLIYLVALPLFFISPNIASNSLVLLLSPLISSPLLWRSSVLTWSVQLLLLTLFDL